MKRIFQIIDNEPIITPVSVNIPEFKKLWEMDTTEDKTKVTIWYAYVYHMCDYNSPYSNLPEDEKSKTIIKDYWHRPDWKPSKAVEHAMAKYKKLQYGPEGRMLDGALTLCDKITRSAEQLDLEEIADPAERMRVAKDSMHIIGQMKKAIESVRDLRKEVERGLAETHASGKGISSLIEQTI